MQNLIKGFRKIDKRSIPKAVDEILKLEAKFKDDAHIFYEELQKNPLAKKLLDSFSIYELIEIVNNHKKLKVIEHRKKIISKLL
jgi:hypothetical protein